MALASIHRYRLYRRPGISTLKTETWVQTVQGPVPTATPTEISTREHLALGDSYFKQGRYDEAIVEYRRVTELDPSFSVAYARWGRILALRQKRDEAVRVARRAVELDAESRRESGHPCV